MTNTNLPSWTPTQPRVPGAGAGGAGNLLGALGGPLGAVAGSLPSISPSVGPEIKDVQQRQQIEARGGSIGGFDSSGAVGQRGAVFNFGGTQTNAIAAAGKNSALLWAVLGVGAVLLLFGGWYVIKR